MAVVARPMPEFAPVGVLVVVCGWVGEVFAGDEDDL